MFHVYSRDEGFARFACDACDRSLSIPGWYDPNAPQHVLCSMCTDHILTGSELRDWWEDKDALGLRKRVRQEFDAHGRHPLVTRYVKQEPQPLPTRTPVRRRKPQRYESCTLHTVPCSDYRQLNHSWAHMEATNGEWCCYYCCEWCKKECKDPVTHQRRQQS